MTRGRTNLMSFAFLAATTVCGSAPAQGQVIWLVKPCQQTNCTPGQDPECGHIWTKAFCTLQEALNAAVPDQSPPEQIWVAGGTYTPGATSNSTFWLKSRVRIYGGFAGTEDPATFDPEVDPRDFVANETILSGELGSPGFNDNCWVVVTASAETEPINSLTLLDGFTVTGASGSAISNWNASPTYKNLVIKNNTGGSGAGMNNSYFSSPTVESCRFESNFALGVAAGGGMARRRE